MKARPLGAVARAKLIVMRREIIAQLDRGVDGGALALLGSVQLAIDAIDCSVEEARNLRTEAD